eukprot:TRINITY_DN4147_c0_g1_i1.p2 TRINITY_DN4147_c0_g1~~TRINITY_DN4147_c0_g1_i1.p2  ORF type:complete len:122 (-),score=8.86 TRINITY_DN4147_c0_g1_i1:258-623(-)
MAFTGKVFIDYTMDNEKKWRAKWGVEDVHRREQEDAAATARLQLSLRPGSSSTRSSTRSASSSELSWGQPTRKTQELMTTLKALRPTVSPAVAGSPLSRGGKLSIEQFALGSQPRLTRIGA